MSINFDHFGDPVLEYTQVICDYLVCAICRIPKDIMHRVPTPLLYSLEGMQDQDLDWEKLLKFQFPDGSFCTSPSSTAFALMQTKDENCLRYLSTTVETFDGGGKSTACLYHFAVQALWAHPIELN